MGCLSRRHMEVRPEQKWDYISLNDFKSTTCFTPFAYAYLWFSLILSCGVYAVDTFTAVQLLAFNNWASEIELTQLIPFDVAKWIFSICIILSFVNLAFEHIRARRIMNRGGVAECYLDNLAVRLESIRIGSGRGWKRFLVFTELTKSKKGAEYIALFTYFSFQSWIRVIVCSGPRQVINALTLLSVYNAKLSIQGDTFENSLMSFFDKIKALAAQDYRQTLILSGMLFTLVVWVFSALFLLAAAMFFLFFLWGYIPRSDGGLSGYCERKINKRLMKIVSVKINKAMMDDERKRRKLEERNAKKNGGIRPISMKATLPNVEGEDKLPEMPMLNRNDTMTTLPPYTSRPGTPGSFELNALEQKRPMPTRTGTMASSTSAGVYSSKSSLLAGAAEYGRSSSPVPTLPNVEMDNFGPPQRTNTGMTNPNFGPPQRTNTGMTNPNFVGGLGAPTLPNVERDNFGPPPRSNTAASNRSFGPQPLSRAPTNGSAFTQNFTNSPATYSSETMPAFPAPIRSPSAGPEGYRGLPRGPGPNGPAPPRPTYDDYSSGRASPAPSATSSYRTGPMSPRGPLDGPGQYPSRSATNPMPPRGSPGFAPQRNMTGPLQPRHQPASSGSSLRTATTPAPPSHQSNDSGDYDYFNRPGTANSQRGPRPGPGSGPGSSYGNNGSWSQDLEGQRGPRY